MVILEFNLWARFFLAAAKAARSWMKSKADSWDISPSQSFSSAQADGYLKREYGVSKADFEAGDAADFGKIPHF